jgi:hypothetical protein
MTPSGELENLAKIGKLKRESPVQTELDGLIQSGRARLTDAGKKGLSLESRFDLGYNAAHALSLAALRRYGYRSESRYLVFQCLPHTLALGPDVWRVLAKAHELRNSAEYEGVIELDEGIVSALVKAVERVYRSVEALGPAPAPDD